MPSHLTRVVFRSIIANEPLLYRGCRQRAVRPFAVTQHGARALPQPQRRTFFGGLFKSRRKIKKMDIPSGLETMSALAYAQRTSVRPPTDKELADALRSFFVTKKGPLEDWHIELALNTFKYLLEHPQEGGAQWFTRQELLALVDELVDYRRCPETGGTPHVQFGTALIDHITDMEHTEDTEAAPVAAQLSKEEELHFVIRPKLVELLCLYGASSKARDIAATHYNKYSEETEAKKKKVTRDVWNRVLAGAARENDAAEMAETTELFTKSSVPLTDFTQRLVVSSLSARRELDAAKFWYSQPVVVHRDTKEKTSSVNRDTYTALLKACALCGDLTFGHEIIAGLTKKKVPDKKGWDAIFLWSAALGKGVDEVDRMMNVMIRRTEEVQAPIYPDIDTINLLVDFAMSKQDPYSAERYISMGEKRGILPDEQTYTMQMQYRLSVKDIDGARAAYYNLQGDFKGSEASVAAVNQLIQVLCESKQHHYDDIMAIVDDLHERKARLAPETVAKLCLLHLRRVEIHDAMDLLQVHAYQYSPDQRTVIADSLRDFILDRENSTADAWDAYQILRNTFQETPREDRIRLMNEFFSRNRSDMACHVFFHMRNHTAESHQANRDVYIAAFTGFARCADAESLELVNNQLKLEFKVERNTKLRNALMLAHASCGTNKKALELWREICESKEGPSYNSIAIAFRSCEGMPWGDQHAKSIWARLREQDIEIDKKIFTAYLSAIARNALHDEAVALVETVEDEFGHKPDFYILSNWYNTTTNSVRQKLVEAWIRERYPKVWEQMEALGHWVTMDGFGYKQYNIDRHLEP
ncbi:uncharacterized protein M421DRAFT_418712 [Didymella exigua CBS 183.55]|uniref:Complex I intermediate-associated protein 84, mitochondrial n=1 Tax=Didymella exigua CBS 183.55 TaxID=1150837 RepID=A0A6A5RSR3_9PLEO|nr:uncharacterized protein M421DRAFT_418712 [Didymella exigua CBS 183.55]KAF1930390.1 hypothetical protein M421DRAFT_418712 [Didymella exigua CBS 183.55]